MFNKKSDAGFGTTPIPSTTQPVSHSHVPASSHAGTPGESYSIINASLTMKGDLDSDADILVQGRVVGNIKCRLLIIDHAATVEGGIEAEEVVVRGSTTGVLRARRARFEKTAQVDSEIWQQSFAAEEGARITGSLHFSDDPLAAAEPQRIAAE